MSRVYYFKTFYDISRMYSMVRARKRKRKTPNCTGGAGGVQGCTGSVAVSYLASRSGL